MFSGGIEREVWHEVGYLGSYKCSLLFQYIPVEKGDIGTK